MEKEVIKMQGDIKDYYMDISTQAKVTFNRPAYYGTVAEVSERNNLAKTKETE